MKQRLLHLALLLVLLVSMLLPTLSAILPQSVSADSSNDAPPSSDSIQNGTFTWYDRNTIHANIAGKVYYFRATSVGGGLGASTLAYDVKNSSCFGRISFDSGFPFQYVNGTAGGSPDGFKPNEVAPKTINVDMDWKDPDVGGSSSNSTCQDSSPNQFKNVSIGDPQNFDIYFTVSADGRSISSVDGSVTYTQDNHYANLYYKDGESTCQDVIQVDSSNGTYKSWELDQNGTGGPPPDSTHSDPGCSIIGGSGLVQMGVDQKLGNAGALPSDPNPSGGGGGAAGGAGSSGVSCDLGISLSIGGVLNAINPLNWLLCGIVKGMNLIVTSLDAQINSMLVLGTGGSTSTDNPNNIFSDSSGCGAGDNCTDYYTAWKSFRNIALGLLVIAGLIIVISQALGMEVLDAYTIRKMLPRVLVAAIAITLSWQLMRFFVTLSNDLGYGVGNLLDAPFHGLGQNIKVGGANGLIGTFALALGGIFFDLFGMLAFVGTAAIAVLVTFLVLTLRQIAVILLIILSPVALISYVLPNTQRVYKFWWESFSKLLLMFPMIVAFITAGHIFSAISSDQGSGFVHQTIAFIAYFAPYFAVPMTFRFSGGLMSGIGNAVNSRADGMRGMLSNVRSGRVKKNTAALGAGTRFEGKKWIPGSYKGSAAIARIGTGASVGWKGRYGFGVRGKQALGQHHLATAGELARDPHMQSIAGYNDANRILAEAAGDERRGREGLYQHLMQGGDDGKFGEGMSEEDKRTAALAKVDKAAKAAKAAGGFTEVHGMAALHSMARDGTAIRDTDDLARLSALNGHGDANTTFATAATVASESRQAGRPDLAAASEPIGALAFAHSDRIYKHGLVNPDSAVSDAALDSLRFDAWQSGNGGEVAYTKFSNAKGRTVRNDTRTAVDVLKAHKRAIEAGQDSPYTAEKVQFAAASLVDTQNAIKNQYGKLNNRNDANKELLKDEGSLDWYLKTKAKVAKTKQTGSNPDGTPIFETTTEDTTNEELVKKIVGDRYAEMSPEERKVAQEADARRAEEEGDEQ